MTGILEPIGAGITVALVNKFIINNSWLWQQLGTLSSCNGQTAQGDGEDEECTSSSSTAVTDVVEIHAHF